MPRIRLRDPRPFVLAMIAMIACAREKATADLRDASDPVIHLDAGFSDRDAALSPPGPDASHVHDASSGPDASAGLDASAGPDDAAVLDGASWLDASSLPPAQPVGVNMPDLLRAYIGVAAVGAPEMRAEMDHARSLGVTHARFIASGYWPTEMTAGSGWVANPTAFFAAFDAMVADARTRRLRLVPSLLWNTYLFPDLAHEPTGKLFVPGSATRMLAERYITEIVTRYKDEDAILFWELGNETNLLADLDVSNCNVCPGSANNACANVAPSLGTPCMRTAADDFFSCDSCRGMSSGQQDLGAFTQSIAALVHGIDSRHGFSTGNGYLRPNAAHLAKTPCPPCDWTLDDANDYGSALAQLDPAGVDYVSVHHYFGQDVARFGMTDEAGIDLLQRTEALAQALGKQLYVGEWGEARAGSTSCGGLESCGGDPDRTLSHVLLDAFVENGVAYSAIWSFEFYQFCPAVPTCYTVTPTEAVAASLDLHDRAYGSCGQSADGTACPLGACRTGRCAPIPLGRYTFANPGDETAWLHWTNCTQCTEGQWVRMPGTGVELTSADLPCTGSCMVPGAYAVSPPMMLPAQAAGGGHVLLHLTAKTSAASSTLRLIGYDGQGQELMQATASPRVDTTGHAVGVFAEVPAGAVSVRLRLEVLDPNASLDVGDITAEWEP
jgi:hypothetical protein